MKLTKDEALALLVEPSAARAPGRGAACGSAQLWVCRETGLRAERLALGAAASCVVELFTGLIGKTKGFFFFPPLLPFPRVVRFGK